VRCSASQAPGAEVARRRCFSLAFTYSKLLARGKVYSVSTGRWQKMRVLQTHDFVIGGYTPGGRNFDGILVGYFERRKLIYVANVHGGFTPALRASVLKEFHGLETERCPSRNLPESRRGQWGEGVVAAEMEKCRWLKPPGSVSSVPG
jgi:ATP-dependent DNA ligase